MALLTQVWGCDLQHAVVRRAVRVMTDGTFLPYRLVLPQERPALFRMALIAGLVDRILCQVSAAGRPVRVMAIGADHLALTDGVA
ncbi:MAG: hypothetical protein A2993_00680 [Gammaproteobacteria bacterium RIFCSPLOWO2_01_FULL_47_190]|nr:MAG: hypothetical protein A2993_00680 [Gammaproteobacteria bacterium RIFCSPLOWO2_01_FULL_47_190]